MYRAYDPCTERYSKVYFNIPEVQKALHANVTGITYPWETCRQALFICLFLYVMVCFPCISCGNKILVLFLSDIVEDYWADSPRSMLPIYRELIAAGLRIWVFRQVSLLIGQDWKVWSFKFIFFGPMMIRRETIAAVGALWRCAFSWETVYSRQIFFENH